MIDTRQRVVSHTHPHPHHTADGLFRAEDLRRLQAQVPEREEFIRAVKEGPQHDKKYRLWLVTLFEGHERRPAADRLQPAWAELLEEVLSPGFGEWLSEGTGIDVRRSALDVNISLREPGDYRNRHRGKPDKALNAVLVLNEEWPGAGGVYELWARDSGERPASVVEPAPGRMYTVVPSDVSWHAVTPVTPQAPADLLTLSLGYWKS